MELTQPYVAAPYQEDILLETQSQYGSLWLLFLVFIVSTSLVLVLDRFLLLLYTPI